jgi:hypothetical protein
VYSGTKDICISDIDDMQANNKAALYASFELSIGIPFFFDHIFGLSRSLLKTSRDLHITIKPSAVLKLS